MNNFRRLVVVLAAGLTVACQSTGPNTTTINGAYALASLNGADMPVVTAGPDSIVSETLQFTQSGAFAVRNIHSFPNGGAGRTTVVKNLTGSYSRDGSSVVLQYNNGLGTNAASLNGSTIRTTFNGDAKVYTAQ